MIKRISDGDKFKRKIARKDVFEVVNLHTEALAKKKSNMIDQGRKITWPSNLNFNKKKMKLFLLKKLAKLKERN